MGQAGAVSGGEAVLAKLTTYKTALFASLVVIAGIGLMWLSNKGWFDSHKAVQATANQVGGLLITTGGLAILWDLRAKRDFMQEVLEKVRISSDVTAAGIDRVTMKWMDIPWDDLFKNSKQVSVFISYGGSWRKNNWATIEKFVGVKGNSLRLFLPDPNDEATMQVLAKRYDYTPQKVRDNVVETTEEFAKLGTAGADVRIYYRAGDPTYTSYCFDDKVLVTLYANRRRRGDVPTLLVGQGTFHDFFKEDLTAIENQSTPVALADVIKGGTNG
ncbi:hypothetical protein [Mycolicibacterium fortuitum]|uniref:hypothetical protein n=1 Tax=Mycolicibacterium fortuitum TaxID=1766 RepID=UPI001CDB5916|nr:hypothetical protein [Mycolicibacterium fortuitum]UBV14922.1 hypothetical protein H8Z57_30270 [Mycolicibacterium fortuitum]